VSQRRESGWKLTFDAARCDGWGMCSVVFPEGISLDPWGYANVSREPIADPRLVRKARRAVACCPKEAITLVADDALTPSSGSPTQE